MDANYEHDIIRRLVYRIEHNMTTLHTHRARYDQCRRLTKGLGFSMPEDCDCGLDSLLAEARAITGDTPSGHEPPPEPAFKMPKPR